MAVLGLSELEQTKSFSPAHLFLISNRQILAGYVEAMSRQDVPGIPILFVRCSGGSAEKSANARTATESPISIWYHMMYLRRFPTCNPSTRDGATCRTPMYSPEIMQPPAPATKQRPNAIGDRRIKPFRDV